MKLFATIYLKGHLIAAMFLGQGATIPQCNQINARYASILPNAPFIKSGKAKISDIRLSCEWHDISPVKNGVEL